MRCLGAYAKPLACLFLLGSFVTAAPVTQTAANSQETPDNLYTRAQEAQRRGDYRAAAEIYQAILKLKPHFAEVHANLGLMHHLLGEYDAAISSFQAALREKPLLFVPNLFLGLDLLQVQKPREAVPYLERAHELDPRDEQAVLGLGRAYTELRNLRKARASYDDAVRLNPRNPDAWFGLGLTYVRLEEGDVVRLAKGHLDSPYFQALGAQSLAQQGQLNDAIRKYRKLVGSQSGPPCLRADLGFALVQQGESTDAKREFQAELRDHPSCLTARLGLARVAADHGDMTVALGELSEVWQADRDFLSANAPRLWHGSSTEKIEALERGLKETSAPAVPAGLRDALLVALERWRREPVEIFAKESTNSLEGSAQPISHLTAQTAGHTRAVQFYSQGRYTACRESLEPFLSKLVLQDLLLLAQCAYDSGDFRTSFLAGQQAIDIDAQSPAARYWRIRAGQILAVNALVQAGLAAPNSPRVHVLLGDVYRDRQDFKEAEAEYRKAIELKPRDAAAHMGLAATFHRAFRLDEALPEVKTVLELIPQDPEANFLMADILVYRHEFAQAEPYAKAALRGDPPRLPRVHALLGKIYASQGRTAEAIAELQQAITDDPDGSFHYQIARLYKQIGDEKAASEALERSEALRKKRAERARETIRAVE
jgi:tetratricopeptide (TPR) repeat protein